jgi:acyl-CoA-dependent ceramide synthase
MEQAVAGADLEDVPDMQTFSNGHANATDGLSMERLAFCASPGDMEASKRRQSSGSRRQRPSTPDKESMGELLRQGVVDHQLGLSLNLVLLAAMVYMMFPSLRERVGAFFWLQYPTGSTGQWLQGPRDIYIVPGFVVIFTGLRAMFMDYVYLPLAGAAGIRQKKAKTR